MWVRCCRNVAPGHELREDDNHAAGVTPTSPVSTPLTPVTAPPPVTRRTVIIHWPDPYQPTYDTVGSLVDDSGVIALATLGPGSGMDYQLEPQQVVSTLWPPIPISVSSDSSMSPT